MACIDMEVESLYTGHHHCSLQFSYGGTSPSNKSFLDTRLHAVTRQQHTGAVLARRVILNLLRTWHSAQPT